MFNCEKCGRPIILIDYPEPEYYHLEDIEWGVHPNESGDPLGLGMLVAKAGASPASCCKGLEILKV